MNKKNIIVIVAIILIFIVGIGSFFLFKNVKEEKEQIKSYFDNKNVIAASGDIVSKQKKSDELIKQKMEDKNCTLENPCTLVNPYEISPLSALIIFHTNEETNVQLTINDVMVTTMEKSKMHAIPIYGLKVNYSNKILLKTESQEKEITIETKDINKTNLTVEVENPNAILNQDIYFLSGPMGTPAAAYDGYGNLLWYLTKNYTLDMEFLTNGHLLLSNGNVSGILYNYDGFLEIDYLGKIYKDYSMKNGYHHELIALKDGTIMVAGGSTFVDAPYTSSFIYRINPESGEILDSLDIYDIFKEIDLDFANSLSGTNMTNNSLQYNEETGELIVSLRGINSILSLNYKTKKLNWIFGDPGFYSDKFQTYLLNVTDNSRYPKGQHTAYLTKDGYLSVFNNDFDILDTTSPNLIYYQNNYSSAVLYEIDGKNIKTKWEYDGNKNYFNYALGSFLYNDKDSSKLIDFGWTYKKSAYVPGVTIYDYLDNTYARIIELNENDEVLFNATIEEGIYRSFKHHMYEKTTANYQLANYELIDNNDVTALQKIKTTTLFDDLSKAVENPYDFELTSTSVILNVIFDDSETVDIIFVGEDSETYLYRYKDSGVAVSSKVNLKLEGNYAVYLKINDTVYDTGKVLSFA